jgi:hypothetical protein
LKTVAALEYLPTTISDFNLRTLFANGTSGYVFENNTLESPYWSTSTFLKLGSSSANPALFGLTPDSRLRMESEGKLSILNSYKYGHDNEKLPASLAFVNNTETSYWRPIGFYIADINENNVTILNAVSVAPFPHTADFFKFVQNPESEVSLYNMTVVVTCDEGLCIGTPAWKNETFDAGNKTSKDGRYELVQLQAVPVY